MVGQFRIVFVDDERDILDSISDYFQDRYDVSVYSAPQDALDALTKERVDILVVDERMPGLPGHVLLEKAKRLGSYGYGILLTAYGDRELLKSYINAGLIRQVLEKPLDLQSLERALDAACRECLGGRATALERAGRDAHYTELLETTGAVPRKVIGLAGGLQNIFGKAVRYASVDENVLISGETGTGKEVLAHTIHQISRRATHPFVKINCGAIPDSLIESELFGSVRGAFTGAIHDVKGKIETAAGGTLFLDEVSELRLYLQSRLLHVVQDRSLERLGSTRRITIDFRLISATNRDLPDLVRRGLFREDLFFRLAVLPLELPPLRQRKGDIRDFASYFLEEFRGAYGKAPRRVSEEAIAFLEAQSWPGNVRELESALKRAVILSQDVDGELEREAFSFLAPGDSPGRTLDVDGTLASLARLVEGRQLMLDDLEAETLTRIIERHDGNAFAASRATGIPKDRFYRALKKTRRLRPSEPE
jgi:DNA-binding NtrC family response regulator